MHEDLWALDRTKYTEPRNIGSALIMRMFPKCNGIVLTIDAGIKNIIPAESGR